MYHEDLRSKMQWQNIVKGSSFESVGRRRARDECLDIYKPMDENSQSVYVLVTRLCEIILKKKDTPTNNDEVKRLRKIAFDTLLFQGKKQPEETFWLPNCNDYHCQFLAWEYYLRSRYDLDDTADSIECCVQTVITSPLSTEARNGIFHVLLQLKRVPEIESPENIFDLYNTRGKFFRVYAESDFQLDNCVDQQLKFTESSFMLKTSGSGSYPCSTAQSTTTSWPSSRSTSSTTSFNMIADEGYESPPVPRVDLQIWDLMSHTEFTKRRTWECFGDPTPDKEESFYSEATPYVSSFFDKMEVYRRGIFLGSDPKMSFIQKQDLLKDLKSVAIGIESHTFLWFENGFKMNPEVMFEGIPPKILHAHCSLMMQCGVCYRGLAKIVAESDTWQNKSKYGHIFKEFCEAINRYLLYYRVAALNYEESRDCFQYHVHVRQLSQHLFELASICKIEELQNPGFQMPYGIELLNYLYIKVLTVINNEVLHVLYSFLFPCLQVYFIRFLRPWILEGIVADPYNEFFVRTTHKYIATRARTYWIRTFNICDELVPAFMRDCKEEVLYCGKSMNMLQLCVPDSNVCTYRKGAKPNLLQCCLTTEQIEGLEYCAKVYQLNILIMNGPQFSLSDFLTIKQDETVLFQKQIVSKRAATMKRLHFEKLEKIRRANEIKRQRFAVLHKEYDEAVQMKKVRSMHELEQELKSHQQVLEVQEKEEELIRQEALKIITHYNELTQESNRLCASVDNHMENIKSMTLTQSKSEDYLNANANTEDTENIPIQEEINWNTPKEVIWNAPKIAMETTTTYSDTFGNLAEINEETRRTYIESRKNRRKIKANYMSEELGCNDELTSSLTSLTSSLTNLEINRNRVLGSSLGVGECLTMPVEEDDKMDVLEAEFDQYSAMKMQRAVNRRLNMQSSLGFCLGNINEFDYFANVNVPQAPENNNNPLEMLQEDDNYEDEASEALEKRALRRIAKISKKELHKCVKVIKKPGIETYKALAKRKRQRKHAKMLKEVKYEADKDEAIKIEEVGEKVEEVGETIEEVGEKVAEVLETIEEVGETVEEIEEMVEEIGQKVEEVGEMVEEVEEKVEVDAVPIEEESSLIEVMQKGSDVTIKFKEDQDNVEEVNEIKDEEVAEKVEVEAKPIEEEPRQKGKLQKRRKMTSKFKEDKDNVEEDIEIKDSREKVSEKDQVEAVESRLKPKLHLDVEAPLPDSTSLFTKFMKTPNFELPRLSPTPKTFSDLFTPADTPTSKPDTSSTSVLLDLPFSKRLSLEEVGKVEMPFVGEFIRQSISIPLQIQSNLVKSELLKHFIVDLQFIGHLENLRSYYFLLNGEYSRHITDGLFQKLYNATEPLELLNLRVLKQIIYSALDSSVIRLDESHRISFYVNEMPKVLALSDINVLECVSLTYEIKWPLNVLLPPDTMVKYDEIFKFLLKVNRVAWVMKEVFMLLKMLSKQYGKQSAILSVSSQYQKLHVCRHVMTHFVQIFQNYLVSDVLLSGWEELQDAFKNVFTIDELYVAHTTYVKKINFLCLLNPKSSPIRKVVFKIFVVILKFYDYLRSREWILVDEDEFVHPNFKKLEEIYDNFLRLLKYFFKIGTKVARSAYQPQFSHLIELLDVNKYYTKLFGQERPES